MDEQEPDVDLRALLATLRRRVWVIVACVVVFAAGAFVASARQPDLYAATSQVRVTDPNADAVFTGIQIKSDPKREVNTQILVIQSSSIRTCADAALGEQADALENLIVSGKGETDILLIRAASRSPQVAVDASNAVATCYVDAKRTALVSEFQQRAVELRRKSADLGETMSAIDAEIAADPASPNVALLRSEKAGLQDQQQELDQRADEAEVEAAVRGGNVELVDEAELPRRPFTPTPARDALLAGALGLLVGLGLAFLLERLDDKVRVEDVDDLIGDSLVLGTIPLLAARRLKHHHLPDTPRTVAKPTSAEAEAFRTVATSLRFSNLGRTKRVIAVTSADAGEGKSTVVANLAVALARSGLKVVAVSGDLRRPSLAEFFALDDSQVGLTSVLLGEVPVTEAVVRTSTADATNLLVLPAGPSPHNPAELLGSTPMQQLLDQLVQGGADYILIDCPPVLPVSDTLALAQHVDGVIVVCVPGQTKADHLEAACQRLRQIGAEIIGVTINGFSPRSGSYDQYGRYEYRSATPPTADASSG